MVGEDELTLLLVFPPFTGCSSGSVCRRSKVTDVLEGKRNQMMQIEPYAPLRIGFHEGVDSIQILRLARIGMSCTNGTKMVVTLDQKE